MGKLGTDGATYQALEFIGEGMRHLSMDERLVLSNLSVEAGAKADCYADEITLRYLKERGHMVNPQISEPCTYVKELNLISLTLFLS